MPIDTMSIAEVLKANRITMTAERTDSNPSMDNDRDMDHWKCTFTKRTTATQQVDLGADRFENKTRTFSQKMTVTFSMGYGHNGKAPKADEVIDCLASDSNSVDQSDFEEWCSELGYDSDSRKAEKTYKACEHIAKRLKSFLGSDLYQTILYDCERL